MNEKIHSDVAPFRVADHEIDAAFLNRWSPRAFSPEPIDDALLMRVFEAARWAASSYNEQPWRFLLARNDADRQKFLDFLIPANQSWAAAAPVLIVIVSKKTFSHNDAPNASFQFDAGAACAYLTLCASSLGLIAHGMAGFDRQKSRAALAIPDDFEPLAVFALGKPGKKETLPPALQEREVPSGRRPVRDSVMEGGFAPGTEQIAEKETENTNT